MALGEFIYAIYGSYWRAVAAGDEQWWRRSDAVAVSVKAEREREREIKGVQQVRKLDSELYVVLTGTRD